MKWVSCPYLLPSLTSFLNLSTESEAQMQQCQPATSSHCCALFKVLVLSFKGLHGLGLGSPERLLVGQCACPYPENGGPSLGAPSVWGWVVATGDVDGLQLCSVQGGSPDAYLDACERQAKAKLLETSLTFSSAALNFLLFLRTALTLCFDGVFSYL